MLRLPILSAAAPVAARQTVARREGRLAGWLRAQWDRPRVVVGSIVLAAAALGSIFSLQVAGYEPDELGYTHLAMGIAHSLSPITTSYGGAQRLNQLYPLLIAPIWGLFGNVTAFRLTHVWNTLLMASAAIPTYLLVRELVRQRWAAYLAAALVAFAPWLTLSTAQLTEVAAYPACAWALLAMYRSLAVPSVRRDAVALLAIGLAAYGRLQLVLLAPVLVLAMLVHELGYAAVSGTERRAAVREAVRRIVVRHALLTASALVGLLAGVPLLLSGKLASAAGFYGSTLSGVTLNGATFDLARSYFAFVALGLGVVPAALAVGFFFEALVVPRTRHLHAFSSLAVLAVAAIVLQVAEISVRFNGSTMQERYVFYIVPLLVAGMCMSLLCARHPARMALGGFAVLALLVAGTHYPSSRTAFWYQASPGMTSFYDWLAPFFGAAGSPAADPGASRQLLAGVAVLVMGLTIAALLAWRPAPTRLLAGAGAIVLVFTAAETTHALWRVVHGNASGGGFGGSIKDVDWVDRHVPGNTAVQQLVGTVESLDSSRRLWEDDEFWNRSVSRAYTLEEFSDPYLATARLSLDPNTGALAGEGSQSVSGSASPRYVVEPARGFPIQLAGTVLAHSLNGTLQLVRATVPLHALWAVSGVSPDGWMRLNVPLQVHLYALPNGAVHCARVGLTISLSRLSAPSSLVVATGHGPTRTALIQPGQVQTLTTRLCKSASSNPQLLVSTSERGGTAVLSPQLLKVAVTLA